MAETTTSTSHDSALTLPIVGRGELVPFFCRRLRPCARKAQVTHRRWVARSWAGPDAPGPPHDRLDRPWTLSLAHGSPVLLQPALHRFGRGFDLCTPAHEGGAGPKVRAGA